MTNIYKPLFNQDCRFFLKTVTCKDRYSNASPATLMRGVSKNYYESGAFSFIGQTHGEQLLRAFVKSGGTTHLCTIQLLKLFFSVSGCDSKDLENRVLLLAFPDITEAVREVFSAAHHENKPIYENLLESVTNILKANGLPPAYASNIGGDSRCAETIFKYIDYLLKKDVTDDEEMEKQLKRVSAICKYYIDMDMFADLYKKGFARGLIHVDSDNERRKLNLCKDALFDGEENQEMYFSTFNALEQMVNFCGFCQIADKQKFEQGGIEMELTTVPRIWSPEDPAYASLTLPSKLQNRVDDVKKFLQSTPRAFLYTPPPGHRKLDQMDYKQSTCIMEYTFGEERIEFKALLMLFDTADTCSFSEMLTALTISHKELVSVIHSLSQENGKLLIKVPGTENILPTDRFELNPNFKHTLPIPPPVLE